MGRHRFRLNTIIDGPRTGEWVTASVVPPGNRTFQVSRASTLLGFVDIHEYELMDHKTAKFVRFVETKPLYGGPAQAATAPGAPARRAS